MGCEYWDELPSSSHATNTVFLAWHFHRTESVSHWSYEKTVKFWDVASRRELATLKGHDTSESRL